MRSPVFGVLALFLSIQMLSLACAQELQQTTNSRRDAEVAAGIKALNEDVRKLSEDVRELVALLNSRDKQGVPRSVPKPVFEIKPKLPTTSQTDQEVASVDSPDLSKPLETENGKNLSRLQGEARAKQVGSIEDALGELDAQFKAAPGSLSDPTRNLDANFRDFSLVDAKSLALKAYNDFAQGNTIAANGLEKLKSEQNILKSVEEKYWDLWAAYKVFETHKKTSEEILNFWRVVDEKKELSSESDKQIAALWRMNQTALGESLNGSYTPQKIRGLRQSEGLLREALGLSTDGTLLRPTDLPITTPTKSELATIMDTALKENVFLRQKRSAIAVAPSGKLKAELEDSEAMLAHEVRKCIQNIQANDAAIHLNQDCWLANKREIEIYSQRLESKQGDRDLLIDNIVRAHLRHSQAQTTYYQHVQDYNKALVSAKYLCSQLSID